MSEFDLIRDYFSDIGPDREDVVYGVGDDGAIVKVPDDDLLVSVMDTLVESIHFPRTSPARSIGHRALAVNLSDIAAMGAVPRWASLSISLPTYDRDWLADFRAGFDELAMMHNLQLIGGDTVSGPLVVTVNVLGTVKPGDQVFRKGAQAGDEIFVTGTLGDAAAGLRSMTRGSQNGRLVEQFLFPQPRVGLGVKLGDFCSAAIDLSDGFGQDLEKLLSVSGVGAQVELNNLPMSAELTRQMDEDEARYLAISGGDDYELCVTVPSSKRADFLQYCEDIECPVSSVGKVHAEFGLHFVLDGSPKSVTIRGHDHFATDE